jgi:conjugative transfer signal peptidase TraF
MPIRKFYPLFFSLILIGFIAVVVGALKTAGYHITYSATASMPRGFYLVVPTSKIKRYDIVEFMPPAAVHGFIKEHRWVPKSGLIIKYVFAVPGDDVCIRNNAIWINGQKIGAVYRFYAFGKLLPQTKICGKLGEDQYLLLSTRKKRSFDGRYFGAVSSRSILGKATPIFITDF